MAKINYFKSCLTLLLLLVAGTLTAVGQTVVFKETFDKCSGIGGNDGTWNSSSNISTLTYDNTGWTATKGFLASKCVRAGAKSTQGSFTTPALANLSGDATLTFKAGAWTGDATTLKLSISGGGNLSESSVTMKNSEWTTYTVKITGGTSSTKITFQGNAANKSRFFLDSVVVAQTGAGVAIPVITPATQSFSEAFTATISAADGANIYYTTDGTDPTATTGTLYTEAGVSIAAGKSITLKAIAVKDGVASDIAEAVYTYIVKAPVITPATQSFSEGFTATISAADGTSVYYTTDGTDPTAATGTLYTEPGVSIAAGKSITLKAIAVKDDIASEVTEAVYTYVVNAPIVSPESCNFTDKLTVSVKLPAGAAAIYYTTDGSDPTASGAKESETDFTLDLAATTTLKAVSIDSDANTSETVTYTYTKMEPGNSDMDGTVIWSEDFSSYSANATPANMTSNDNATYSASNSDTKLFDVTYAGGTAPELLLKSKDTFTINIKSLNKKFGQLMFTYLSNKQNLTVSTTTTGVTVTKVADKEDEVKQYMVDVPDGTSTVTLVMTNGNNNARIDNLMLAAKGTFAVTSAGYATYYTDKAFIMPEGVTGQTVTAANGGSLTIDDTYTAGGMVPAGTPLLLKGDASEYHFTEVMSDSIAPAANLLHGTLTDATTDYTEDGKTFLYYKLAYNDAGDKLGFYWDQDNGAAFTNAAGKAYLALEKSENGAAAVSGYAFEDMVTAISAAAATGASSAAGFRAYDMSGRRVQAASAAQLRSGLYIVNGKKVMVK